MKHIIKNPRLFRKPKGTLLKVTSKYGNGEIIKTVGFLLENQRSKNRLKLSAEYPPSYFQGKLLFSQYVPYDLIQNIEVIRWN